MNKQWQSKLIRMYQFGLIPMILFFLVSCGGGPEGNGSGKTNPIGQTPDQVRILNLEKSELRPELSCSEGACPEYLGLLHFKRGSKAEKCQAVLLSKNMAMTAAHCIQGLRKGDSCEVIDIEFMTRKRTQVTRKCLSIHQIQQSSAPGDFDIAYLKLTSNSEVLDAMPIDRSDRLHGKNIKLLSYREKSPNLFELRKKACQLQNRGFLAIDQHHPRSRLLNTAGCDQLPGDSGAPLIDSDGYVIGTHYGSFIQNEAIVGVANNFGCLCENQSQRISEPCQEIPSCHPYQSSSERESLRNYALNRIPEAYENHLFVKTLENDQFYTLEADLCDKDLENATLCQVDLKYNKASEVIPGSIKKNLCLDVLINVKSENHFSIIEIENQSFFTEKKSVIFETPQKCPKI